MEKNVRKCLVIGSMTIYITGGYDYCFYRSADGQRHDISDPTRYPHKNPGQVPWVIFRKR